MQMGQETSTFVEEITPGQHEVVGRAIEELLDEIARVLDHETMRKRAKELNMGDNVLYVRIREDGLAGIRWDRYFSILDQIGSILFIWDHLTGQVKMIHEDRLTLADIRDWEGWYPPRRGTKVGSAVRESDGSEEDSEDSDDEWPLFASEDSDDEITDEEEKSDGNSDTITRSGFWTDDTSIQPSEEESEENMPLSQWLDRFRAEKKKRKYEEELEEDMPLSQLSDRLRAEKKKMKLRKN